METKKIDQEIQKAEGYAKDVHSQIEAEEARLQAFGSKEAYYDFLAKEKQALNDLEILKSKKRTAIMQEICDREITPRVEALRSAPLNESQRINLISELALFCEAAKKIKTNFVIHERTGEVLFETLDPQLQTIYGEKREEVATYLKRIPQQQDVAEIKDEKWVLKDPTKPAVVALPYQKATSLEKEGKGQIVSNDEPIFEERIREDVEPAIMESVRRMNLGSPIEIDGKLSDQAKSLERRAFSGRLELSPVLFGQFVQDRDVQKVLKKFE